ncbi:MAG: RsmE family RNA methyltransferase [bacterium]
MIKLASEGSQLLNKAYYFSLFDGDAIASWQLRRGEIITIEDCLKKHFRARVIEAASGQVGIYIFEECHKDMEPPVDILLLQALPSRERMEWIIQKTVELGIKIIVPFKSTHSISLEELKQPKAHRWQRVALKAAKQCRRASIPEIHSIMEFPATLSFAEQYEVKIMLWQEAVKGLASLMPQYKMECRIALLVGPEGGFSQLEIEEAQEAGFIPVSLGPRILRTETAAIIATGLIQYLWGDLGD